MPVSVKEAGVWKNRAASAKSLNIFKKSDAAVRVAGIYLTTKVNTDPALILEFLGGDFNVTINNSAKSIPYQIVRVSNGVVTHTGTLNNGNNTVNAPPEKYRLELLGALTPLNPIALSSVAFDYDTEILNILHIDDDLYGFNTYPQTYSTVLVGVPSNLPPSITSLSNAFENCDVFNSPSVSGWNTGNVTTMYSMFNGASAFNQSLSGWNTSNVTTMRYMFQSTQAFNQNISGWNTGNVTAMGGMFQMARAFNQSLSGWNTGKVTNMGAMFNGASVFNQNISGWDVTKVTSWSSFSSSSPLSAANKPPKFR